MYGNFEGWLSSNAVPYETYAEAKARYDSLYGDLEPVEFTSDPEPEQEVEDYNADPDGLDQLYAGWDDAQASAGSAIAGPVSGFLSDYVSEDLGAYTKEYGEDLRDRNLEESAQVAQPKSAEEILAEDPDSFYKYLPDKTPTGHQILRSTPTSLAAAAVALPAALGAGALASTAGLAGLGVAAVAGTTGMVVGNATSSFQVAGESYERAKNDPLIRQELGIDPDKDFKDLSPEDQQTMDRFATDLSKNAFGHRVYTSGAVEMISYIPYGGVLARYITDTGLGTASEVWDRSLFTEDATDTLVEYGMPRDKAVGFQKKMLDAGPGLWETFWPALVQEAATGGAFVGVETIVTDPRVNSFATSTKFQLEQVKESEKIGEQARLKEAKEDMDAFNEGIVGPDGTEVGAASAKARAEGDREAAKKANADYVTTKQEERKIEKIEEDRLKEEVRLAKELRSEEERAEKIRVAEIEANVKREVEENPKYASVASLSRNPEIIKIKEILDKPGIERSGNDLVDLDSHIRKYGLQGKAESELLGVADKKITTQEETNKKNERLKKKVKKGETKKYGSRFNFAKNLEPDNPTKWNKFMQVLPFAEKKEQEGTVKISKRVMTEVLDDISNRFEKLKDKYIVVDNTDAKSIAQILTDGKRKVEGKKEGSVVEATYEENQAFADDALKTGRAWTFQGKIFMNADLITGKTNKEIYQQIVQLGMFHEPIAHLGLKGYLSKGLSKAKGKKKVDKFLDDFYKTNEKDISKWEGVPAYLEEGQDLTNIPNSKKQELAEEYLANNFVEFGVRDPNIVAKLADSLTRGTLSVFGRDRVTLTQAQDILAEVQRQYLGGKRNIVTGDFFDQSNWLKPKKDTTEEKKEELQKITKVGRGGQPLSIDRTDLKKKTFYKKNNLDDGDQIKFAKRISTPEKRSVWQKLNKANPLPEIKRRDIELTALAQKLEKGEIEFEEYRSEYDKKFPVKTFNKVPPLSSGVQIAGAIDQGQYDKGKLIGEDSDLTGGMEALVRFDVNSMSKYNVGVVTAVSPQAKGSHYGKAAHLVSKKDGTPVKMITKNKKNVLGIAAGESKFPMAYFKGEWKGSTAPQIKKLAQKLINKPNWIQVGMDPKRQSSFYARETKVIDGKTIEAGTPIDTAEEVLQVGMFALVKNPTTKAVPEFTSRAGAEVRFAKQKRSVAFESFWGEDSPMRGKYEKSYNQLTQEQKAKFSYNVADKIADIALKRTGVTEKGRIKGWGFWEDNPMSPNMILNISATDQDIQNLMDTIGLLAQQEGVVAFGPKNNAPNVGIDIYDNSDKFSDPDLLDKFYRGLLKASPWNEGGVIRGASQTTVKGNIALRIILENTTAKGKTVAGLQANNKKLQKQRREELSSTINELEKTLGLDVTYESFQAKMFETYNNWKNPENGYRQRINQNFRPKVSRRIQDSDATTVESTVRKQFDDFGIRYSKKAINGQDGTTSQGTYKGRLNVESDDQSHFVHWSHSSDLVETDPSYHGTGIAGREKAKKKAYPDIFVPRTYVGLPGYSKEGGLGKNMYEIQLDPNTIYDGNRDPDGFIIKIKEELGIPSTEKATDFALIKYENSIKEAGYVGYFNISAQIAALFNPTTLKFTKEIIGQSTYVPSIRFSKKQSQPTAAELEAEFRKKGVKVKPDTSIPKDKLTLGNKKKDAGGLYTREAVTGTKHIRSDANLIDGDVVRTAKIFERSAGAHAIATRSWNPLKPLTDKYTAALQPYSDMLTKHIVAQGTLPDSAKYKALRRVVKGIILKAEDNGRVLYDILQDTKQSDVIFKYFTTKDSDANLITDIKERNAAIRAKEAIDDIGKQLELKGLMKKKTRESFEGQYLPRAYLSHLLGKDEFMKAVTRGGVGTDFKYLKARKDIPEGVRKLIMGEIQDPAYLASKATTIPVKDLAILDWLDQIATNDEWIVPKTMVKFDTLGTLKRLATEKGLSVSSLDSVDLKNTEGVNVSGMWLSKESSRIDEMVQSMPDLSDPERKLLRELTQKMAKASMEALQTSATIDTKLYTQIPPDQPKYGMLAGMAVRKEIADDIFAGMEITTGDTSLVERWVGDGSLVQKYGRFWKWAKVPANPPSYVRNFSSNLILMQMSGMNVTDMPGLFIDGIKDMHGGGKNKGKLYQLAKDLGLTAGGFSQAELGKIESEFKKLQTRLTKKDSPFAVMGTIKGALASVMDATTDFYGGIDSLGKMMMINNELKKRGLEVKDLSEYKIGSPERQSLDDAALEAEKWLFDYSNVKGSVRYLRNAPFGAPFMSFTSLVAPLMLETLITKPWKFAPYYALGFAMKEWFKNENDVDEEELESLTFGASEYLQEKIKGIGPAPVIPLPYLDKNGRVQFLDVSYIYPWGMFSEMFGELSRGEIIGALKTFGIFGSPVNNIVSAINTGVDPFSRKKIVDENGTGGEQFADIMWYAFNLTVPSMLHGTGPGNEGFGAVRRVYDSAMGKIEKDGEAKFTMGQSVGRLGGFNVTPLAVPEGRNKQMRYEYSQLLRLQRLAKRDIKNMYIMQKPKEEIKEKITDYKEKLISAVAEFKGKLEKSKPPKQLIKAREAFLRSQKQKALAYKNS